MLEIKNLSVRIGGKEVLKNINLEIQPGEIHALMGPNGSGKTSLAHAVMGHPQYEVVSGDIRFDEKSILALKTEERAKLGIFLSFQEPPEIGGVGMETFLRTITKNRSKYPSSEVEKSSTDSKTRVAAMKKNASALRSIKETLPSLGLSEPFLTRYVNDGFSGGEKKKSEMLQMLAFKPRLAIIDEVDSGLDLDSLKVVAEILKNAVRDGMGLLLISHYTRIFELLEPIVVHVLGQGEILQRGDVALLATLDRVGFEGLAA